MTTVNVVEWCEWEGGSIDSHGMELYCPTLTGEYPVGIRATHKHLHTSHTVTHHTSHTVTHHTQLHITHHTQSHITQSHITHSHTQSHSHTSQTQYSPHYVHRCRRKLLVDDWPPLSQPHRQGFADSAVSWQTVLSCHAKEHCDAPVHGKSVSIVSAR